MGKEGGGEEREGERGGGGEKRREGQAGGASRFCGGRDVYPAHSSIPLSFFSGNNAAVQKGDSKSTATGSANTHGSAGTHADSRDGRMVEKKWKQTWLIMEYADRGSLQVGKKNKRRGCLPLWLQTPLRVCVHACDAAASMRLCLQPPMPEFACLACLHRPMLLHQ